jgi:hypothetical protein
MQHIAGHGSSVAPANPKAAKPRLRENCDKLPIARTLEKHRRCISIKFANSDYC